MSPPTPHEPPPQNPTTPRRTSAAKHGETIATPAKRRASAHAGATPKSAPAASAGESSQRKKPEPTLLADFFLGRPSPARKAAQRSASKQRRKSVALDAAGVREELRQEMRAAAVRRVQQPGGVHERVKAWQKSNVIAMKAQGGGVPNAEDVRSEPTEVGVHIDAASVTEEDRVRIKLRLKAKKNKENADREAEEAVKLAAEEAQEHTESEDDEPGKQTPEPRSKSPPKKRIVSDSNWMKRGKGKSPPRAGPAKPKGEASPSPRPIPKDFLQRTARNPSPQNKVKEWAKGVELPEPRPEPPRVKQYHHHKSGETVTVEEAASSVATPESSTTAEPKAPVDDGIRVKPMKPKRPKIETDDGIRIYPTRKKEPPDDGIRVHSVTSTLPDDGIRIRPGPVVAADEIKVRPASARRPSVERSTRIASTRRDHSPSDVIELVEESETEVAPPTRKRRSSQRRPRRSPSPTVITQTETTTDSKITESEAVTSDHDGSDDGTSILPTVLGNKSLADIPVGYSAFSELDLPLGADARNSVPKKPKAQRNPSFKAMPNVFKKVVSGAKEIIHDKVDPPRTAVPNIPPSIESWLSNTVDPFVEGPSKKQPAEEERAQEARKSSSPGPRQKEPVKPTAAPVAENQENADPRVDDSDATPRMEKTPTSGLKRSRATRSPASPLKSGGKKPFREALKEAFRGQSGGHKLPPTIYPSCEADDVETEPEDDEEWGPNTPRRHRSPESSKRPPSPDPTSTVDSTLSSSVSTDPGFRRRPPPTNGIHELSTIVSEGSSSFITETDTMSTVSQTTVTQATAFTKSSGLSRHRSQRSGLKRRLTKHSDLVSVLSLPDDGQLVAPSRSKSIKSSRSLHRRPSKLDKGKVDDLLDEFADDEHFYLRELKTLVDGVVPVLLKQVVHGDASTRAGLFDRGTPDKKADSLAKSVVNMGVALEKLRNFHRRVPLSDIRHLLTWLEAVSPIYDNYLDVWRLGFQDLIVNLAPLGPDDEDSLLNALPRDENGDVLGENGERVDVAYLLKRPLIRIKWMTKFLKAATWVVGSRELEDLLSIFESLQEKARKRHREETARMTDEDAINTDTTRARDLRNLAPVDSVVIDQSRQVAAKDLFSLDLDHSSGQRLECQVELVHRDNLDVPTDKGDVLIREIGNSSRSWLLFPPVAKENISARRSDGEQALVVMIRGTHNWREWFELIKLSTNNDDQIADWLDILGSDPYPPTPRSKMSMNAARETTPPRQDEVEIPVGERKLRKEPTMGYMASVEKPKTLSRYHHRQASAPSTLATATIGLSSDHTSTRDDCPQSARARTLPNAPAEDFGSPSREPAKLTKPRPNSTPYRDDGAPPPPIHRTLTSKSPSQLPSRSPPNLSPPAEHAPARVKRRTSSPLKHEYHPSDISSGSSSGSEDDSETSQSSSDELDEDDVPDTIPGYSIKPSATESMVSESSIAPSQSASQVGVSSARKGELERHVQSFVAAVSYWSNRKGIWKDITVEPASIVVHPGSVEVHRLNEHLGHKQAYPLQSSGTSEVDNRDKDAGVVVPLVSLVLTPVVMIRRSTALDLEVRSRASHESRLKIDSGMYRFRAATQAEAQHLYEAVHQSRLNNARYIQLSEEARVRSFGQQVNNELGGDGSGDGGSSGNGRSWFGRKNSYRASTRAPSMSQGSGSTSISANSFLKRLTGGGNTSFNLDKSTVDKQSRPGSGAGRGGGGGGGSSLYTSSASSGGGSSTPPRSISISLSGSGSQSLSLSLSQSQSRWSNGLAKPWSPDPDRPLEIRCHLAVQNNRWADKGDCILTISRPPPGVRQELALYHGMEKRVIVTHATKKTGDKPLILLDAVLGSKCFSMLGNRGIMCSVWENLRDEDGNVGMAPRNGALAGRVTKWCFQCKNVQQAQWIMGMVTSEVPGLVLV
ncbi:hypothetical protein B0H66DRAFT_121751 [Apodospora peruviana]|uniref:Uncharacterized protein n=1 Tax=Apodospora peruviana TaxID=516989 RepID=A0AAE0IJ94_9PEZI|nr:hypothetical protein B0H66DRAFT_121751 [Apodospora peruviana]